MDSGSSSCFFWMANAFPLIRPRTDLRGVKRFCAGTGDRSDGAFGRLDGVFDLMVFVETGHGVETVRPDRTLVVTVEVTGCAVLAPDGAAVVADGGAAELYKTAEALDGADEALDERGAATYVGDLSVIVAFVRSHLVLGCSVGVDSC